MQRKINFKIALLFMVTMMIFSLFLIPIIVPFGGDADVKGFAYTFWYLMCFILALVWGACVERRGCWFFSE